MNATADKGKYLIVIWAILETIFVFPSICPVCLHVKPMRLSSRQSVLCSMDASTLPQLPDLFYCSDKPIHVLWKSIYIYIYIKLFQNRILKTTHPV